MDPSAPQPLLPFLPIFGQQIREEGYDLPLPIGVSVNYLHVDRDIDVSDIKVQVGSGPKRSVNRFVQPDADSSVDVVIGRVDVWVLPFLNVAGYVGWQQNKSDVKLNVTLPPVGPLPGLDFKIDADTELDGVVYGTGITLAGGYEAFFVTANADFAFAEFDEFDSRFEGRVYGVRTGWAGEVYEIPLRVWSGFMYYDTKATVDGRVNV